jgi:hypothetical protein
MQATIEKTFVLHLRPSLFDKMGIERTKRYRAIERMEKAGILKIVTKKIGQVCTVELMREKLGDFLPF